MNSIDEVGKNLSAEDRAVIKRVLPFVPALKASALSRASVQEVEAYHVAARMFGDLSGKSILDYGCGSGHSAKMLSELGEGVSLIGVDESYTKDSYLRAKIRLPDVDFLKLENGCIPLPPNSVDGVFSGFVHAVGPAEAMIPAHCEIARVLPKDGPYIILVGHPDMGGRWRPEDFERSLEPAGLQVTETESVWVSSPVGQGNRFLLIKAVNRGQGFFKEQIPGRSDT